MFQSGAETFAPLIDCSADSVRPFAEAGYKLNKFSPCLYMAQNVASQSKHKVLQNQDVHQCLALTSLDTKVSSLTTPKQTTVHYPWTPWSQGWKSTQQRTDQPIQLYLIQSNLLLTVQINTE